MVAVHWHRDLTGTAVNHRLEFTRPQRLKNCLLVSFGDAGDHRAVFWRIHHGVSQSKHQQHQRNHHQGQRFFNRGLAEHLTNRPKQARCIAQGHGPAIETCAQTSFWAGLEVRPGTAITSAAGRQGAHFFAALEHRAVG